MNLSFENTENAFAHLTDKELKNARFLFQSMSYPWLVQMGTRLTPFIMRTGLPVHGLIRKTLFKQFVGGETLENTEPVTQKLHSFGVEVILDYGVEGKEGEDSFDTATEEFMRVIRYASTQTNIPFISIKVTGLARFGLLQSLNEAPRLRSGIHDHEWELDEWDRVRDRMYAICELAAEKKIGVLIDAEESWIQDPVDRLCMEMMQQFNTTEAVVYNTVQLYRHDRLSFLKMSHRIAREKGFVLGVKLVRGAYMEKERARALEKGYDSPIQPDKAASDRDFNAAVQFCLENLGDIAVVVASHNENSNQLAAATMDRLGIARNHSRVHFSQLYGMSDHITFNMAREGFRVSKYLPFGPIREVIPYLMRRAQENTSVSGQTGRELTLIQRELQRRKKSNSPVLPTAAE
ncbi:MAG: proline dehydrogenase family protein [Chitinophagaceae bacterium]|nr:proline dehydrogenase family protein [Chitinophagaceae bacterium]MCA6474346.1 proline dehydrogenase family protein [Chitinophagaceae bacterium]MCA6482410.1 proline dehydrogenase family protein [Chitinophagaceae bacterium]MCA6486145.1 proline dehydrogenase family protein [Chitinophagaceae bacterium]MCA6495263.1 proline dehydrogenase family protein [Chitinophagaceae bacterium]